MAYFRQAQVNSRPESGRGLPHSKTFGIPSALLIAKRLGVRQSSGALDGQGTREIFMPRRGYSRIIFSAISCLNAGVVAEM